MLNPSVIENFLHKPRENFDWLKEKPFPETTFYGLPLWTHQKVALLILSELKRFITTL